MYILFNTISRLSTPAKLFSVKTAAICRASTIKIGAKFDKHLTQKQSVSFAQSTRFLSTHVEKTNWDKIYDRLNDIISKKHPDLDERMNKLHVSYNTHYVMFNIASKLDNQKKEAIGNVPEIVAKELRTCGGALADQNERATIIEDLSQGIKEVLVLDEPNAKKTSKCLPK